MLNLKIIMKQATLHKPINILHKIETIEEEVLDLKLTILKELTSSKKNLISLKGILKGTKISDSDIEKAKKSLCSKIEI